MPKSPFDLLVRDGVLTREALASATESARRQRMSVGWVLVNENKIPLETLGKSLAAHYRVPFVAYREDLRPLQDAVDRLKPELCLSYRVAPIAREKDRVILLMADPGDLPKKDELEGILGVPLGIRVALEEDIHRLLTGRVPEPAAPMLELDLASLPAEEELGPAEVVLDAGDSPIVVMANMIVMKCFTEKGEEIRLDPRQSPPGAWRVGGEWRDLTLPDVMLQNLVRRFKVMANLDLGNRAKPQQGFFQLQVSGSRRRFDLFVEPVGGGDEAARLIPVRT